MAHSSLVSFESSVIRKMSVTSVSTDKFWIEWIAQRTDFNVFEWQRISIQTKCVRGSGYAKLAERLTKLQQRFIFWISYLVAKKQKYAAVEYLAVKCRWTDRPRRLSALCAAGHVGNAVRGARLARVRGEGGCGRFLSSPWATRQNKAMHHGKAEQNRSKLFKHDWFKLFDSTFRFEFQLEVKKTAAQELLTSETKCWSSGCQWHHHSNRIFHLFGRDAFTPSSDIKEIRPSQQRLCNRFRLEELRRFYFPF